MLNFSANMLMPQVTAGYKAFRCLCCYQINDKIVIAVVTRRSFANGGPLFILKCGLHQALDPGASLMFAAE